MSGSQTYRLDGTSVYAEVRTRGPTSTRCFLRHNGHEVAGSVKAPVSRFSFEQFIRALEDARFEDEIVCGKIEVFPDWDKVAASSEDDWSPID